MKVLFITNYPSPYRVDFFNELGKLVDITVVFEENEKKQKHRDSNWFNTNYDNFEAVFLKPTVEIRKKTISLEVKKYINSKYDLIIVTNYSTLTGIYAIHYMKKRHIKFAIEADGAMHKDGKGIVEKLKKNLISSASWWFSTSDVTDEHFLFYGAKKKNIYRYPFTSLFEKDLLKKQVTLNNKIKVKKELGIIEDKVILSVGSFIYRKGFDVLINSCQNLPDGTGIYIIGGKATEEYTIQRDKLGLKNIHFIDFKSKEELQKYYKASDLFVLPTRDDVWGLVVNEAMASGLPVITTDKCIAGLELITNDKNGYIIPNENALELNKKMLEIFNNDCLRDKMGMESLKKSQYYTIEKMAAAHLNIFKKIIN